MLTEIHEKRHKIIRGKYVVSLYLDYCNAIAKRHHSKHLLDQSNDIILSSIVCKGKNLLQVSDYYRVLSTMCPLLPCFCEFVNRTVMQYKKIVS